MTATMIKDPSITLGFEAPLHDRMMELLNNYPPDVQERFRPSMTQVAEQLEFMTPIMVCTGKQEVYEGRVALEPMGTILFVFADEAQICLFHFAVRAGVTFEDVIADTIESAGWLEKETGEPEDPDSPMGMVPYTLLKHFGQKPGKPKHNPAEKCYGPLGFMFRKLSEEQRNDVAQTLSHCIASGICPVIIGALGSRDEDGGFRGCIWPTIMPLAPYAEYIDHAVQGTRLDA